MSKKILGIISVLVLLGAGCSVGKQDTWIGIYYPDASNLFADVKSSPLGSLEMCRQWVMGQKELRGNRGGDDYECGKNCEYREGADLLVCDETIR